MNALASRLLRSGLLGLVLILPAALRAADGAEGEDSPLHTAMEEMGKSMRTLNKALTSADPAAAKADILAAVQKMQTLAVESKVHTPVSIEKLPEAERPAKLAAYRADLAAAIIVLLELERAVLADNWELAKETYAKVRTARKEGHEKYNPEEGH
jgi:hypothetical protein